MGMRLKSINFGKIDHFLYVRIMSLCADLRYTTKDFIVEGYNLFFDIVDPNGISRFILIKEELTKFYKDSADKRMLIPRMSQKHAFVVIDIPSNIVNYLNYVRTDSLNNNDFTWSNLLCILLMLVEIKRDKIDEEAIKEWDEEEGQKKALIDEINFCNSKMVKPDNSYKMEPGYSIIKR